MNIPPWTAENSVTLLLKMEHAATIESLQLSAEEAKDKRIPERDKELMRAIYATRLKQLKDSPRPPGIPDGWKQEGRP